MRRASSGLATRSQPSICLLCRISSPARRHFSSTTSRLRVASKGKGKGPTISYTRTGGPEIGSVPYFLKPNAWRPAIRPPEEERPWSIGLLKERLGMVFKRNPEDPNMRIIWGEEATAMRKDDPEKFKQLFREYVENIRLAVGLASPPPPNTPANILQAAKDIEEFKKMYSQGGISALDVALMDTFIMQKYDSSNCVSAQRNLADFSHPAEWYPKTRTMKRTWHLHVGPTNSGKTYNALKRLEEVDKGVYCGPLRLLAHEVFMRLNAKGIKCNLRTGEETKLAGEDVKLWSTTVEMAQVEIPCDVAVIDEIQMLSDTERGWAWTQAVLGIMAKELHLCGEERAVGIVEKLAKLCGDELIIHRYQRLGKLEVMKESLNGDFTKIEKGDCVVGFSRKDIHSLKKYIEHVTGLKCAIVYGALPAETRAAQAKYFNDPKNDYDVLVASDAIGLGLNLSIKRVIFSTMYKFNGRDNVEISIPLTRQIAGRAGRYRSAADDAKKTPDTTPAAAEKTEKDESWDPTIDVGVAPPGTEALATPAPAPAPTQKGPPIDAKTGYTTTLVKRDLEVLQRNMQTEPAQIEEAIVLPRNNIFENYCALFKAGTPFHEMLSKIASQASVGNLFKFTNVKPMIEVAKLLEPTESERELGNTTLWNLSDMEKIVLSLAPVKLNLENCVRAFREFARIIAEGERSTLLTISDKIVDIEALDIQAQDPTMMIKRLEELHTVIMLYSWCSQRFRHVLTGDHITETLKSETEIKIDSAMKQLDASKKVVLRQTFREDARKGRSVDLSTISRGTNLQRHPNIAAAPRKSDNDRLKAQIRGSRLAKPAHATSP
ncbi:RNA helicase [Orbilia javanica]|uniref:RNA helicase n=1 Tax=Orbilia javanica TaxID=47235 RepID=A0AAN8MXD3_9PEZI